MFQFMARRTLRLLVTLIASALIVFMALRIVPGDPATVLAGIDASPEDVQAMRTALGMDKGLLSQLASWFGSLARFDLGVSMVSGEPVISLIKVRLPVTAGLAAMAMALSLALSIPLGVAAAADRRGGFMDIAAASLSQIGMAIPGFWLGILLLLAFAISIPIFPLFGADTPLHLVLPAVGLGIGHAAVLLRMTKASLIRRMPVG